MKRYISIALLGIIGSLGLAAQDRDSTFSRDITVEREFQPIIKDAGKINRKPEVVETTYAPTSIQYSTYTGSLSPDFNVTSLMSQPVRFEEGEELHGAIRAGFGHRNTLFDFAYTKEDGKKNYLDVYANHDALWGPKTLEDTRLGFTFRHKFTTTELYFGVEGSNCFYTRYGKYFDFAGDTLSGSHNNLAIHHFAEIDSAARQNIWQGSAHIGLRSANKSDIQYDIQTGYNAFHLAGFVTEHQLRTRFNLEWTSGDHHVGATFKLRNMFFGLAEGCELTQQQLDTMRSRHALFIEPYYEYVGKRVLFHLGVNLNTVFGKGTMLAAEGSDIAFAPSPNVYFEAQIAPRWLTIYGSATGHMASGSIQDAVEANRFYTLKPMIYSHHVGAYTPVDAEIGFHIKAHKNLLIEIHGGYAYHKNAKTPVTSVYTDSHFADYGMLDYFYADEQVAKIGAAVSYHWKDYINLHVWGDYFMNKEWGNDFTSKYFPQYEGIFEPEQVYGHPKWHLGCTIDSRIDRQWSVYTNLHVVGSRMALVDYGVGTGGMVEKELAPMADWNLGARYDLKRNLGFFLELQNMLCRYNELYYGYQSEGMQFRMGVDWKF